MKKSLHSLIIAAIVSVTAVCGYAAEAASEAVVLNVKGDAKASLPGQSAPVAIKAGDKLPQGTQIQTGDQSEVQIQAFSGSTTTIGADTKVDLSTLSITTSEGRITKQTALLDLKVGSLESTLDPANKAINDYSVRTPKGVAAARGTVYTVTVAANGTVRTFVARGLVVFQNAAGQSVTVPNGYVVTVDENGNISEPAPATDAERGRAREQFRQNPGDRAIDITISPSS